MPFTAYQRRLFVLLSVATFFEGFDILALSQILPTLRREMGLSEGAAGLMLGVVNVGTVAAYLLVERADRWGRRRVLMLTIAGYTLFSFLSGLAPEVHSFTALQLLARVFLIGEYAVSMVYAAEEFPAERRGLVLGVIQGASSVGAVTCAATVPLLISTPLGWRMVYFVGLVPLLLLIYARRGLVETQRFSALGERRPRSMLDIWRTPYRRRVIQLGVIWMATYLSSASAVTFWKDYAIGERGLSDAEAAGVIAFAAIAAMPMLFASGKLLDLVGRKPGAAIIYLLTALGTYGAYALPPGPLLTGAVALAMFGVSATLPVMNAFTSELFPTELRAEGYAWANNLLGRLAFVASPIAIGAAAEHVGWGLAMRASTLFPVLAVLLIALWLPETRALELEDSANA